MAENTLYCDIQREDNAIKIIQKPDLLMQRVKALFFDVVLSSVYAVYALVRKIVMKAFYLH